MRALTMSSNRECISAVDGAGLLGDEAVLARLLGESPGPDELTNALAAAAKGGHAALCRRLLNAGAPVDGSTGPDRVTPLMWAVSSCSHESVEALREHGADVAAKNVNGSTALHIGIARDASLETINLLLRSGAGAQIETSNEFGDTPLRVALERGREEIVQLLRESQRAKFG